LILAVWAYVTMMKLERYEPSTCMSDLYLNFASPVLSHMTVTDKGGVNI
jgi:hypothetical protein